MSRQKNSHRALHAEDAASSFPDDLTQRLRAFQESRVLLTAVELDLFTAVGQGATAEAVSRKLRTDPRATEMLMNALVATEMLAKRGSVFYNKPAAAQFFVEGSAANARNATLHLANLWPRWSTLTECVRAGTSVARPEAKDRPEEETRSFIAAMHRNALQRAPLVVKAVGARDASRMLDVGGGSGAYSIAFARANPKLHATLLDVPSVIPIAQNHIQKAGVAGRVKIRPGDLRKDSFEDGFDLVFVSAICHMLSPAENLGLLQRSFRALVPKGRIVVQDFILEPDKTAPKWAALFALNMLVNTHGGSSYSGEEYSAWLKEAGFENVRRIALPGPAGLMVGVRP